MSNRENRRPESRSGGFVRRALLLSLVVALPFACDDDGTSPDPDVDELPDTIPSGTYEVDDLYLPAGERLVIGGDVVVLARGVVVLEGDVVLNGGATLGISAEDSLVVAARIGGDTAEASSTSGPPGVAPSRTGVRGLAYLRSRNVVFRTEATMGVEDLFIATTPGGTVRLDYYLGMEPPPPSTSPDIPGADGGSIHIGDDDANGRWVDADQEVGRPDLIEIQAGTQAGSGGAGYSELQGTLVERVLYARGSDGGHGGDLVLSAREIRAPGVFVGAGNGARGGSCGQESLDDDPHTVLQGADGAAEGEPGVGIVCVTGTGGRGGNLIIDADIAPAQARGGRGGAFGYALVRAGNGGPGGPGGNVEIRLGHRGAPGTPSPDAPPAWSGAIVSSGGNGGASNRIGLPGGGGGSVSILDVDGATAGLISGQAQLLGPMANGGAGYSGCDANPFAAGTPGGAAGSLIIAEDPMPLRTGTTFEGGAGAHGRAPAAGGSGGFDDSSNRLGPDGASGLPCNDPATVVSVEPLEDILDEVEFVVLEFNANNLAPDNCEIEVNGEPVEGECTSPTEATATAPADVLHGGENEACIENGAPAGGVGECGRFFLFYPSPVLDVVRSPTPLEVGESGTIIGEGSGFIDGTTMLVNGNAVTTERVSDTEIRGSVTPEQTAAAGELQVSASVPHGFAVAAFRSIPVYNKTPKPTHVVPSVGELHDVQLGFELVVHGTDFMNESDIVFQGVTLPTTRRPGGELIASVPGNLVPAIGTYSVTVTSPGPLHDTPATLSFDVVRDTPFLESISPFDKFAGEDGFILTLIGAHFDETTRVMWGDVLLDPPTLHSSVRISLTIPKELIASPGLVQITTVNGPPGGGTSPARPFHIRARPAITSVTHPTYVLGTSVTVGITGTDFVEGRTTVYVDDQPAPTEFLSTTQLNALIEPTHVSTTGSVPLTVLIQDLGASLPYQIEAVNPVPTLQAISHSAVRVGHATLEITVTGSGFATTSEVVLGSIPLATTYVDGNTLRALVPASLMDEIGFFDLYVFTPTPGGGVSGSTAFQVYDRATLVDMSPSQVDVGGPSFFLEVVVEGAAPGAQITINGVPVTTTDEGDGILLTRIDESLRATAGTITVGVLNPGDLTSTNTRSIEVRNPAPVVESLTFKQARAGLSGPGSSFGFHVRGTGFVRGSKVHFNGQEVLTTYVDATTLHVVLLDTDVPHPGTFEVTVVNGGPGGGTSNGADFLLYGSPTITDMTPREIAIGGPAVWLEVVVSGAAEGAQITINGQPVATDRDGDILSTRISEETRATAQQMTIGVTNPGGPASTNTETLTIQHPQPTLFALAPDFAYVGMGVDVRVELVGENIVAGAIAWFDDVPLPVEIEGDVAYVTVPAVMLTAVHAYGVHVVNPSPSAGPSAGRIFEVLENPAPTLYEIDPWVVRVGTTELVMTVLGSDFVPGATVLFGDEEVAAEFVSSTELRVPVPPHLMDAEASYVVRGSNPAPGGGISPQSRGFDVVAAATLVSVEPATLTRGSAATPIAVTTTGFVEGGSITLNGQPVPTQVAGNVLTGTVPQDLLAGVGHIEVGVTVDGEPAANTLQIEVRYPDAVLDTILPASAIIDSPTQQVLVYVENYTNETTITWEGETLPVVSRSDLGGGYGSLVVEVDAARLTTAGTFHLAALNPGGATSGTKPFTVVDPFPHALTLSRSQAVVGSATTEVVIRGSNFDAGATAWWTFEGGTKEHLTITHQSADSIVVLIATDQLDTEGSAAIHVENPPRQIDPHVPVAGPFPSSALPFEVTSAANPCTEVHPMSVGTPVTGTFTSADCTRGSGASSWRERTYELSTGGQALELVLTATPRGSVRIRSGGLLMDYVISFGTATTRKVFLPAGTHQLLVETSSGSSPDVTFTLDVHDAPSASVGPCTTAALGRPPMALSNQMLESTDCVGINRFDSDAGNSRYDPIALGVANGERVQIEMRSDVFQPVIQLVCSGPCPTARVTGTPGSVPGNPTTRTSTVDFVINSSSGAQWRVELSAAGEFYGAYLGAYDASIQLNGAPLALDACDVANPALRLLQWDVAQQFRVNNEDCAGPLVGGAASYFELYRLDTPQDALQLDFNADVPTFEIWTPAGELVMTSSSTFRKVFFPAGAYVVKPSSGGQPVFPALLGTMRVSPASEELLHCNMSVPVWPGASTTQTLEDHFDDLSCSDGDLEGNERRYDGYRLALPPGRSVEVTMTSAQVDPVLLYQLTGADWITEDTPGDGISTVVITNDGITTNQVTIRATTPRVPPSDQSQDGTYHIAFDWVD